MQEPSLFTEEELKNEPIWGYKSEVQDLSSKKDNVIEVEEVVCTKWLCGPKDKLKKLYNKAMKK